MEELKTVLQVAQTISPIGIIFLLALVIYNMTAGKNLLSFFKKTPTDTDKIPLDNNGEKVTLESLHLKLNKIATNHLHSLPDMEKSLARIEQGQTKMLDTQTKTNEILIEVKTLLTNT